MHSFFCLRKMHIVTSFSIGYANKDIQLLCAKNAHSDAIFNALHGARFARKIFSNHTCRFISSYFRMFYLPLDAILVFESPYFTELASLATFLSSPLVIGCLYFDDILINKYLDELINTFLQATIGWALSHV